MSAAPSTAAARPLRAAIATVVVLAFVLGAAERGFRLLAAVLFLPTSSASWIWAQRLGQEGGPTAFYLAREFDLDAAPAAAPLAVTGDEEYLLWVNGRFAAAGRTRGRPVLHHYDVAPLLRRGTNRLVVELRSSRGAGGFLARLELPGEPPREIVTDRTWRTYFVLRSGLLSGELSLQQGGEAAKEWAFPPTGRWRYPAPGGASRELAPEHARAQAVPALRMQQTKPEHGQRTTYLDWGAEVEGYLVVHYRGRTPLASVQFGRDELPGVDQPAGNLLIGPKGRSEWQDSQPRRFRYVVLRGLARVVRAEAMPAGAGVPFGALEAAPLPGLLGLEPPPRRSLIEW